MLSDLAPRAERACKDLFVLDLHARTLEAHTPIDTMELTLKLDVCTSEDSSLSGLPAAPGSGGHVFITRELL